MSTLGGKYALVRKRIERQRRPGGHTTRPTHTRKNEETLRGRTWRAHNTIPRLGAFHFLVYRLSRAHNGCNDSCARVRVSAGGCAGFCYLLSLRAPLARRLSAGTKAFLGASNLSRAGFVRGGAVFI